MSNRNRRPSTRVPSTRPWTFICAGVGTCSAAFAQTTNIPASDTVDTVTVTTTRIETPLHDAPATVSVISDREMAELLVEDIKDLVRFEPGVAVRRSPARFAAAQPPATGRDGNSGFNIRGLEGNRVLILVDGVRVPDGYSFGGQSVGRGDYVDLDVLKTVEIVRGPASALYGSDGLAGAVSFTTKDPADLLAGRDWSVRAHAGYDSADEGFSKSIVAAGRVGEWESLLSYTRRDGEEQETQGTNNIANVDRTVANPEDNSSNSVLFKNVFSLGDAHRVRLTWDHLDRDVDWNVLSAIAKAPLTATSTLGLTAFDEVERNRYMLDHRYEADSGLIRRVDTAVYYQDSHTRQFSSENRNTAADRIRDATFDNIVRGVNVQLLSEWQTGAVRHRFVYGGDYSVTRQESLRTGTIPPPGEVFPSHGFPTTDHTLAGIFVQDEIVFGDSRVTLYPALRWDAYEIDPQNDRLFVTGTMKGQDDSQVSPKLGAVVRLTDELNVFANAATGFKAPSPSQVNSGFANPAANYQSLSNPDLKPESSETVELGLRWHSTSWSGEVVAFSGEYDDFIEQIQVGGNFTPTNPAVFQYVNLTSTKIHGAEARANFDLSAGFSVDTAASYAKGDTKNNGVESALPSIEPFKLVGGLRWEDLSGRFGSRLIVTYSDSKSPARTGVSCTPSCYVPDSFVVVDLFGWWQVTDALTLRAGILNLADEKYTWWSDARGLPSTSLVKDVYTQPGRNASVSLSMQF